MSRVRHMKKIMWTDRDERLLIRMNLDDEETLNFLNYFKKKSKLFQCDQKMAEGQHKFLQRMLFLFSIPILFLLGISLYFTFANVNSALEYKQLDNIINMSGKFSDMIMHVQLERDMSVLNKCAGVSISKLNQIYLETTRSVNKLKAWPPQFKINKSDFDSKISYVNYLNEYRKRTENSTCFERTKFYSDSIKIMIKTQHHILEDAKFGKLWSVVVAYEKLMLAKDSATILRTLGVIAIMDPNDESLEQFYMDSNSINSNYRMAALYWERIGSLENAFQNKNDFLTINNWIKDIKDEVLDFSQIKLKIMLNKWYANATKLVEVIVHKENSLNLEISSYLKVQTSRIWISISISMFLIITVLGISPIAGKRIYRLIRENHMIMDAVLVHIQDIKDIKIRNNNIIKERCLLNCTPSQMNIANIPTRVNVSVTIIRIYLINFNTDTTDLQSQEVSSKIRSIKDAYSSIVGACLDEVSGEYYTPTDSMGQVIIYGMTGDKNHLRSGVNFATKLQKRFNSTLVKLSKNRSEIILFKISILSGKVGLCLMKCSIPTLLIDSKDFKKSATCCAISKVNEVIVNNYTKEQIKNNTAFKFKYESINNVKLRKNKLYYLKVDDIEERR